MIVAHKKGGFSPEKAIVRGITFLKKLPCRTLDQFLAFMLLSRSPIINVKLIRAAGFQPIPAETLHGDYLKWVDLSPEQSLAAASEYGTVFAKRRARHVSAELQLAIDPILIQLASRLAGIQLPTYGHQLPIVSSRHHGQTAKTASQRQSAELSSIRRKGNKSCHVSVSKKRYEIDQSLPMLIMLSSPSTDLDPVERAIFKEENEQDRQFAGEGFYSTCMVVAGVLPLLLKKSEAFVNLPHLIPFLTQTLSRCPSEYLRDFCFPMLAPPRTKPTSAPEDSNLGIKTIHSIKQVLAITKLSVAHTEAEQQYKSANSPIPCVCNGDTCRVDPRGDGSTYLPPTPAEIQLFHNGVKADSAITYVLLASVEALAAYHFLATEVLPEDESYQNFETACRTHGCAFRIGQRAYVAHFLHPQCYLARQGSTFLTAAADMAFVSCGLVTLEFLKRSIESGTATSTDLRSIEAVLQTIHARPECIELRSMIGDFEQAFDERRAMVELVLKEDDWEAVDEGTIEALVGLGLTNSGERSALLLRLSLITLYVARREYSRTATTVLIVIYSDLLRTA